MLHVSFWREQTWKMPAGGDVASAEGTDGGLRHRGDAPPDAGKAERRVAGGGTGTPPKPARGGGDQAGGADLRAIATIAFALMAVLGGVGSVLYPRREQVAATPCQGICSISPEAASGAPPSCRPEDPWQLFYPHVPKTAGTTMKSLLNSRKHLKAFELVELKEWRDAVPGGVVWLSPRELGKTSMAEYERQFRLFVQGLVTKERAHRSVFFGHVFFHNFSEPISKGRRDSVYSFPHKQRGVTVLREPVARLASQYAFDRSRAKSTVFQEKVREEQGDLPFAECAASERCRADNEFARWCALETRYLCGWGPDCRPSEDGGATPAMLARAKAHLGELFAAVGVQEQWDRTAAVLEAKLPTYFEGLPREYREGNPANCGVGPRHWYQKYVLREKCPYHKNKLRPGAKHELPEGGSLADAALREVCWADLELYAFAVQLLEAQAAACGV